MRLDVDISLRQGAFTLQARMDCSASALGVFGPSGSGKSTLMRTLAGLAKPDSGRIALNGEVLFDSAQGVWVPPHRRGIGMVFQDARLFPHWSTAENLRAGLRRPAGRSSFSFDRVVSLLELDALLERPVGQLSGGEQQRAALGRALLAQPRLLLMDEPVSGLDARLKEQILPFLARVHCELRLPCILVSHSLPEILQMTDQLALLKEGRVCALGDLARLVEERESYELMRRSGLMSQVKVQLDGTFVRAGVRPDEVLLATHRVQGLSARCRMQGTVVRLLDHGATVLCLIDTEGGRLMAGVTPAAVRELNLREGTPVWCLFKAVALNARANA
jgi:molybdate transport system ATP-binding protein